MPWQNPVFGEDFEMSLQPSSWNAYRSGLQFNIPPLPSALNTQQIPYRNTGYPVNPSQVQTFTQNQPLGLPPGSAFNAGYGPTTIGSSGYPLAIGVGGSQYAAGNKGGGGSSALIKQPPLELG